MPRLKYITVLFSLFVSFSFQALCQERSLVVGAKREFDSINNNILDLWKSDECFLPPASASHEGMERCWLLYPERAQRAREATYRLISRLESIKLTYPSRRVVVGAELNLMTKAGMFCNETDIDDYDLEIIFSRDELIREWISSILVCSHKNSDYDMYSELRGKIKKYISSNRLSILTKKYMLKIWFRSFIYQYNELGDFSIVSSRLNDNENNVYEWKVFIGELRKKVSSPFRSFSSRSVSVSEIVIAKSAISSL